MAGGMLTKGRDGNHQQFAIPYTETKRKTAK
jgi:hypothetical protein